MTDEKYKKKKKLLTEENADVYSNFGKEKGLQDVAMAR